MKEICSLILILSISFLEYSQTKEYSVFKPKGNYPTLLVATIYKKAGNYFIETKKGEIQPAVLADKVINDTVFSKVENFANMINLKYYSRDILKSDVLIFYDKKNNLLLLKQTANTKVKSYKFYYHENSDLMLH